MKNNLVGNKYFTASCNQKNVTRKRENVANSPNKLGKQSRVMQELNKFLNANLGKLNKYEEEVKKELFKSNNNEEDNRSRTPGFVNSKHNETNSKLNKPVAKRNISQNKLDVSTDKTKTKSNVSKIKYEKKAEKKNKEVNNLKSIKKDDVSTNKPNKININKPQVKKDVCKFNTIDKVRPLKLELSSCKKDSEVSKNDREELIRTGTKISNKIIFLDEPQMPKEHSLNNCSEDSLENKSKISNNYVNNLLSSISTKLQLQDEEIKYHNNKLSSEENKALTGNYLNGLLGSIINKFREETKLLNESGISDNFLKRSSLNFVGNLFGSINSILKNDDNIKNNIFTIETSNLNNDEILKTSSNDKIHVHKNKKRYSHITSSHKNSSTNTNPSTSYKKNSQDEKKLTQQAEKRILFPNKNNSSMVQQNIIINNTFIENSPTIVLNIKKSISHNDPNINNENCYFPDDKNHRKNIKEKALQTVNEKKKSIFKQADNSSTINKKDPIEDKKEGLNSFRRNSQKINSLVEKNEQKINENKDQTKECRTRDLSSDAIISGKTMDRLNKSRSKFKETSVTNAKQSEEFQNKIEAVSKLFNQKNRLSLSSEPCNGNIKKEEEDNTFILTTLDKPMRIKAVVKKTKKNFN